MIFRRSITDLDLAINDDNDHIEKLGKNEESKLELENKKASMDLSMAFIDGI